VLTSSFVDGRGRQGNALIDSDIAPITVPVLWVHHQHDPCRYTRYATVKGIAERLKQPLITVSGTEGAKGAPCEAYSEHGFAGREIAAIRAIRTWVRTGVVTPRVEKP
jgi:pimeloyl-ACP methyl ester carboxylesterase